MTSSQTLKRGGVKPPGAHEPLRHNPDYIRQISSRKDAEQLLRKHSANSWDAVNGEALKTKEREVPRAKKRAERASKKAEKARKRRDGLDARIPRNRYHGGADAPTDGKDTPFKDWSGHDQALYTSIYFIVFGLLGLGVMNVKAVIIMAEIPAFIENPTLAWMLGGLVPAASVSLKSGYHICKLDSHKHIYAWSIFITSVILTLLWVVLFALSFEGASGDITTEMLLGESTSSGGVIDKLRNIVQIIGEIVIGASLFIVNERIHATYSGVHFIDNPNLAEADKTVTATEALEAQEDAKEDRLLGEVLGLHAQRNLFIDEGLAMLHDFRSGKRR